MDLQLIDILVNNIRYIICISFLFTTWGLLFIFLFTSRPLKKMLNLALTYNSLLVFIVYIINIYNKEDLMIDFLIMSFICFLFNMITGISIINNLLEVEK